jgi:hypothetical protein
MSVALMRMPAFFRIQARTSVDRIGDGSASMISALMRSWASDAVMV